MKVAKRPSAPNKAQEQLSPFPNFGVFPLVPLFLVLVWLFFAFFAPSRLDFFSGHFQNCPLPWVFFSPWFAFLRVFAVQSFSCVCPGFLVVGLSSLPVVFLFFAFFAPSRLDFPLRLDFFPVE